MIRTKLYQTNSFSKDHIFYKSIRFYMNSFSLFSNCNNFVCSTISRKHRMLMNTQRRIPSRLVVILEDCIKTLFDFYYNPKANFDHGYHTI